MPKDWQGLKNSIAQHLVIVFPAIEFYGPVPLATTFGGCRQSLKKSRKWDGSITVTCRFILCEKPSLFLGPRQV